MTVKQLHSHVNQVYNGVLIGPDICCPDRNGVSGIQRINYKPIPEIPVIDKEPVLSDIDKAKNYIIARPYVQMVRKYNDVLGVIVDPGYAEKAEKLLSRRYPGVSVAVVESVNE